jgi:hypothetical protein
MNGDCKASVALCRYRIFGPDRPAADTLVTVDVDGYLGELVNVELKLGNSIAVAVFRLHATGGELVDLDGYTGIPLRASTGIDNTDSYIAHFERLLVNVPLWCERYLLRTASNRAINTKTRGVANHDLKVIAMHDDMNDEGEGEDEEELPATTGNVSRRSLDSAEAA